jgi:hypothetical protein
MKTTRIATIDVFRAITMFLMLFVNDIPGIRKFLIGFSMPRRRKICSAFPTSFSLVSCL